MIIDDAINCVYDLFQVTDEEFAHLFPGPDQDIEFVGDVFDEVGVPELLRWLWTRPVHKRSANGIHGTLFVGLPEVKELYPNRRDSDLDSKGRAHSGAALTES